MKNVDFENVCESLKNKTEKFEIIYHAKFKLLLLWSISSKLKKHCKFLIKT